MCIRDRAYTERGRRGEAFSGAKDDRLNQDLDGGIVTEGQARPIHHANKGTAAADLGNECVFAKSHLTNTLAKGWLTI